MTCRALLFCLRAILVLSLGACGNKAASPPPAPPPLEVEVLALEPSEVRETGEYLGSLQSRTSVNVLPQVTGYVRKILIRPGQTVEAGAVLVEIDGRAETAALDTAEALRRSAEAQAELARQTLDRTESLAREGLVSVQELEGARSALRAAEAALRASAAGVAQRQVELQYHGVRAAISGVVGDVLVRVGDHVDAHTQLTSIAQADALEVSVAIPALRARSLKPDTPMELLDAGGNVLARTTVFFTAPQVDPRTQLVEVKGAFRNVNGLRPGELLRTRLIYGVGQALQVPALAVFRQSGQPFVFAVTEKEGRTVAERRPLTLGALGERAYVVEKGLTAGTQIVLSSLQMLRDGAAIVPKPKTPPSAAPASGPGR
jgi:RND family efflux transporter MFP subunit